ncbi:MAG: uroporphyrinogen decarboxylase family protein [Limnochordia bacterium]|jgi:hypothetical protein|nr:hypothetical protein [Bacillota bacterium]
MSRKGFDYTIRDAQETHVEPIPVEKFDLEEYHQYELALREKCRKFWSSDQGVAVYRRFRAPGVFASACRNMKTSLELQLGALKESMKYKADIPNFLEPWYGIGTVTGAFGLEYIWHENQAPATKPRFSSIAEALSVDPPPVEETEIGGHILNMIEYFLDKTKGKIPMSFTDTQSPINNASYLISIDQLFLEMYDNPEAYTKLLSVISQLLVDFSRKQQTLIGDALVYPGHGFASSRVFQGIGMSDDNTLMISDAFFTRLEVPHREKVGSAFNGCAFHSCGNWTGKIQAVKAISNLVMVDGAYSDETDPDPNPTEPFREAFCNTGIVLNARIVGDADLVAEKVKELWSPGMKLIVVTYCQDPKEQAKAYDRIHEICS